jgi:protease-4
MTGVEEDGVMAESNGEQVQPVRSPLRIIFMFLIVIVLPLAVSILLAPRLIPKPRVGIIRLNNDINGPVTDSIGQQLAYAREHEDVRAVVLVINSPGGSAAYSEELFLDVWSTRAFVPIVATVDLLAASGAYYMAAAADEIYAKPTSAVGSIGVIAFLPDEALLIEEEVITTGPFKSFGETRDGFIRQMEVSKFSFLEAIQAGRGDRLNVDPTYLSRAEIWNGVQAADMGLIDGLMPTTDSIKRAAELAGLANYDVVELWPLVMEQDEGGLGFAAQPALNVEALYSLPDKVPAGIYYRYMELPSR